MLLRPATLAFALSLTAVSARAQQAERPTPTTPLTEAELAALPVHPLTLTVSGGVSLGAYESGVNWALLYLLKLANEPASWTGAPRPDSLDRYELVVATGASAGNINALLSSAEWARRDFTRRTPEETLFWDAWVNVGMGQLLPEFGSESELVPRADSEGTAALTRRYFDGPLRNRLFSRLMPDAGDAFDPDVDVALGIALTRVNPSTEVLERSAGEPVGLRIRTQRAVAVYRMQSIEARAGRAGHLFISHHDATRTPLEGGLRTRNWLEPIPGVRTVVQAPCLDPGRLGQLVLPAFREDAAPQDARANAQQAYRMTLASSAFPLAFEAVPLTYVGHRSPTGLATLSRFASGIIPAARQQELELLARTLEPYQRDGLTITNRFAPVVGATLGAFGSFTDPSFRQYDFYVGIYDGFHYVARQVLCARRADGTGCAERVMGELRRWGGLPTISPVGDFIFGRLYEQEFGAPPAFVAPASGAALATAPEPLDYDDRTVFNAVIDASRALQREGEETNFAAFIHRLAATRGVRETMGVWGEECRVRRDSARAEGADPAAVTCRAEPYTLALLDRPEEWLFQFYEEVVERLQLVENENPASGEVLLELAQLGIGSAREQQRRGYQWSTTSIPRRRGRPELFAYYALPSEIAAHFPAGRGVSVTYTPVYRFSRRAALTMPITPLFLDASLAPPDTVTGAPGRNHTAVRFALGPGLLYQPKGLFGRTVEVRALYTGSFTEGFAQQYAIGGELATYLLAGKIRLAYQVPSILHGGWDNGPPRWSVALGLSDVNGLLYWLGRTLQ